MVERSLNNQISQALRAPLQGGVHDPVTGLYSRWYLELRLREEVERCRRYGTSFALVVIRLAGVGLAALATDFWVRKVDEAGELTTSGLRVVDIVASLGPAELAICLVNCDSDDAKSVATRLTDRLAKNQASIGVVVFPQDELEAPALIEVARNRARTSGPSLAA
jgi:diguanylate cyclase (GGDEF)-like protein